jgi:hypothetical protein
MMRVDVTKSPALLTFTFAALGLLHARPARAEGACVLRGEPVLPSSVAVYDAPVGGTEIAHFTGAKVALSVSSFPESPGARAAIETRGFRLTGFVRAKDVPVFTTRAVPVYAGHVWIGEARRVAIIGAADGRLRVEKSVSWPLVGSFQGWAPCESLTLEERVPPGWSPPGGSRGYVVKRDHIELFSEANGAIVTAIDRAADGPGALLWSDSREGAWIHVEHHGDVVIDAWARAKDVSPLPPGETMDQLAPGVSRPGTPRIQLQGQPKVVRVPAPIALRAAASDAAAVTGGIDAGVEVAVLDVVAGWASVIPKALNLAPSGTNQFWVRAKDLGI